MKRHITTHKQHSARHAARRYTPLGRLVTLFKGKLLGRTNGAHTTTRQKKNKKEPKGLNFSPLKGSSCKATSVF